MKNLYKKIITLTLSFSILVMSLFVVPQKTESIDLGGVIKGVLTGYTICYAQGYLASWLSSLEDILSVPTGPAGNKSIGATAAAKECGFDYAANQIKQELISGILKSTTEWVKGGYNGKPAFLANPDQFLEEATDQFVADIIENGESTKFLCNSFKTPLKFAVNLNFYTKNDEARIPSCTMSYIEQNVDNALGDLKNFYNPDGSLDSGNYWNSFIRTNTTSGGNAYESYIQVSDDLKRLIGEKNAKKLEDVNRNGGYMSIERCDDENSGTYAGDASNRICGQQLTECLKSATSEQAKNLCNSKAERCIQNSIGKKNCEYVTPGKVVADELSSVLGMERENLQMADEFDELIAAIITQMMSKVFDSNKGLSGINESGDGKDYESAEEKDISVEKSSMIKQYNPRAYDIQLKIYQSLLDALQPEDSSFDPIDIVLEEEKFWAGKNDSMLDTESRMSKYWSAAGYGSAVSSNWNVAFISYVTGGNVRPIFEIDGRIKSIVSSGGYTSDGTDIKKGSVVCTNDNNKYCTIVVDDNKFQSLGVVSKIENGKTLRTLGRTNTPMGNVVIFTPPKKDVGDKYNNNFYNTLYGDDYDRFVSKSPIKRDMFAEAINKWKEFKGRYTSGGQTTLFWADGFVADYEVEEKKDPVLVTNDEGDVTGIKTETTTKKYLKHNMNFQYLPESVVDEVIRALSLNSLSGDKIDNIRKLRDQTIRDREEAHRVSEEIKKATKVSELWEINGNNAKADLSKAYKIYQQVKEDLDKSMLGTPNIRETPSGGKSGYSGGLATLAAIAFREPSPPWRWTTLAEKEAEDKVEDGPSSNGKHWHIHIMHDEPFTLDSLKDIVVTEDEVKGFGVKDIKLSYDPIDDIRDLDSGLYNGDDYDYQSF